MSAYYFGDAYEAIYGVLDSYDIPGRILETVLELRLPGSRFLA